MPQPSRLESYESVELEPDQLDADLRSEVRSRRGAGVLVYVLAVALSGIAVALGAYAWQLMREKDQLTSDVAGLTQKRDEAQQKVSELLEEKDKEQQRSREVITERDDLQAQLAAANAELDQLNEVRAAQGERLAEFNALKAKFQRMIDAGALDITFRRGRMIVEMPAAVLFDSGSAELSEAGQDTVTKVAKILRGVPRHRFLVGGHTDNVPAVKAYKSNWELSAARAVRVTELLTRRGVSPNRLVIAGYAEYDPVSGNTTEAGRQKNRRIEIILEPYVEQKVVESLIEQKSAPKATSKK